MYSRNENDLINNSKPGDIVLIFMRYHYHFGDEWLGMNDTDPSIFTYLNEDGEMYSRPDKVQHFEEWISRLENLADSLATKNVQIIISSPTPLFPLKFMEVGNHAQCSLNWFNKLSWRDCEMPKQIFNGERGKFKFINIFLRKFSLQRQNVHLFDGFDTLCKNEFCKFSNIENPLYKDLGHLTNFGSINFIYPHLNDFLQQKRLLKDDSNQQ